MQKSTLLQAIVEALRAEFDSLLQSSKSTRATGNDPHSKAEGKYDTRSTEENYLADGLARQAQAALEAAAAFERLELPDFAGGAPIELGALVELEFPDEKSWFFLGPAGGGTEVVWGKRTITVLTPESPLGGQLRGRRVGDVTNAPKAVIRSVQ